MTEFAANRFARLTAPLRRGPFAILFWILAAIVFAGAVFAVAFAPAAGWHGFILLLGLAIAASAILVVMAKRTPSSGPRARLARGGEELARAAFEAAPEPMLVTGADGSAMAANAAYLDLAAAAGAARRLTGLESLLGADSEAASAMFRLARGAQSGQAGEAVLPALDTAVGPRILTLAAQPLGGGEILWTLSEAGDAAYTPAPKKRDRIAEDVPAGIFTASPDGRVLYMNRALRDWLRAPEDIEGLKLKDVAGADGARAILDPDGGARAEIVLQARDGVKIPVVAIVHWPDDGGACRAIVYDRTRTGAPAAKQAAPDTAARTEAGGVNGTAGRVFDDMFASAPFGVARLDSDDPASARIEEANPALQALTGGQAEPGETFATLFADGALEASDFMTGEPMEAVLVETARDAHLYFARDREGRLVAYIVDVSRWKELERQLVQSQKMQAIGQLAGGVAHDFNNLLTAIRGNCDLLLERHPVGDPAYPELQQINQTVSRAAGLVRKLLAFSRKQTFRAELIDVTDLLSDLSVLLRQVLEESVKMEMTHGRDLPLIKADKGQVETALMNLSTNARDAMRGQGGGALTIRTSRAMREDMPDPGDAKDGDYLLIEVGDTGSGMDAETRQKIFEPFFTTKEPGKGTGLGLATVYGIVKQSGGYLFVDTAPGEGTHFHIYLPAAEAAPEETRAMEETTAAKRAPKPPADLAGRGRILLVEDEAAVRQIAAKTLVKRGYEVLEAEDGEEALALAEQYSGQIDLMISDVVMPGLDGPGLLEKAREHLGDARVIFMSGYAEEEFSDVLSRERDVSFLPKPFTLPQLAERVKETLGRG